MARMLTTRGTRLASEVLTTIDEYSDARWCCQQLESGQILYLPRSPVYLSDEDRHYLVSLRQDDSRLHKNISYRPAEGVLRGFASSDSAETDRMRGILRAYSDGTTRLLTRLLAPYAGKWTLDFASFRPFEEQGRDLSLHKRNDLLHVDAFPSRPTRGARILRCFTNINPTQPRVWLTAERFPALAERYARDCGLARFASPASAARQSLERAARAMKRTLGLKAPEYSPYDRFMLRFHDYLKENEKFQQGPHKVQLEFAPGSTWIVFTDSVPHAALSGRFALEQTYLVNEGAMTCSQRSPLRILEKLCGRPLAA